MSSESGYLLRQIARAGGDRIAAAARLSQGERARRVARAEDLLVEEQTAGAIVRTQTREHAVRLAGFGSDFSYRQARRVVNDGALELVGLMDSGGVSISGAARIAGRPLVEQADIVGRVVDGSAKDVRDALGQLSRESRIERIAKIAQGNAPLEVGPERYPVIYVDPPWRYEHVRTESRAIENQYPTMTLEEICALSIGELATPDAVLFLWATSPMLEAGLEVVRAWGFKYKALFVWDKIKHRGRGVPFSRLKTATVFYSPGLRVEPVCLVPPTLLLRQR